MGFAIKGPSAMSVGPALKPWIEAIHAYVPGKSRSSDGRELVKLSANENPLGCSPLALEALGAIESPHLYPDPDATALREALGAMHGIEPANIVCGAGSGEMLQCMVQAVAGPGDEVLFSRYSFSLYPLLAHKVGAAPVMAEPVDYAADVDNLLAAVTPATRIVLLDNPNNPVGSYLVPADVKRLHRGLPRDVVLVVDQAYAEYVAPDEAAEVLRMATEHENVLVTRTFAKAYGLAGERVGWATGAPTLVGGITRLRGAFNVSLSGQRTALAGLRDQDFVTHAREHNARVRHRFAERIRQLGNYGLRALPSEANFVLVLFEGALSADTALETLAEGGYAVRHLPGQGLAHALRITIGSESDMDAVADLLRQSAEAA